MPGKANPQSSAVTEPKEDAGSAGSLIKYAKPVVVSKISSKPRPFNYI